MADWILGVDAGGSRTSAVVWEHGTDHFFEAEGGPGNPWSAGLLESLTALEETIAQVLGLASLHPQELAGAALGIAGNGRQGLPAGFRERVSDWGLPRPTVLTSDLVIAARASLGERPGIHLVAGTGSALAIRSTDGSMETLGGWGWFLGDPASAFDLGRRALQWLTQSWDGLEGDALLEAGLVAAGGPADPAELPAFIADPGRHRAAIARLAPAVLDAAARSRAAERILQESVSSLRPLLLRACSRLPSGPSLRFGLSGGMARHAIFTSSLQTLMETLGEASVEVKSVADGRAGALVEAAERCGLGANPEQILAMLVSGA